MALEFCVHTGFSGRGPFFTKCGFKTKAAARRWARRNREPGETVRVQQLAGA